MKVIEIVSCLDCGWFRDDEDATSTLVNQYCAASLGRRFTVEEIVKSDAPPDWCPLPDKGD